MLCRRSIWKGLGSDKAYVRREAVLSPSCPQPHTPHTHKYYTRHTHFSSLEQRREKRRHVRAHGVRHGIQPRLAGGGLDGKDILCKYRPWVVGHTVD